MTHVALCIALVGVMPFLLTLLSKSRGFTAEDNKRTREWQSKLTGWRQRAYWAHQNAFEAIPLFAALAILALMRKPDSSVLIAACWSFVALRVAHGACYIADAGNMRSVVWFCSLGANVALLLVSLGLVA